jgi:hypothetical protein
MSETAESVLTAALSLSDRDREAVTLKLLERMPPPEGWEEVPEDEIVAEVLRRHEKVQRESIVCRSAGEVHDRLQAEIDAATPR